jgi:hypothetical protein
MLGISLRGWLLWLRGGSEEAQWPDSQRQQIELNGLGECAGLSGGLMESHH